MFERCDEREWMPQSQREKYLTEGLRQISEYAYERAPAMKKKFDDASFNPSAIRSLKDLEKIPVTTRDDFIRIQRENPPFGGFLTVPPDSLKRIYVHPGPQYEIISEADVEHSRKMLPKLGIKKGDIVINTVSYHLVAGGLLVDEALTSAGITVVPTGVGNTDLQVQIMHDLKVTFHFGFTSFLMSIVKRAEELGYDFKKDFSLRGAIVLRSSELRETLERDYGIDGRETYGFLPVGFPACECEQKSGMHVEEDFIVEVVDPETGKQVANGEIGELVVTTIFNELMPRIRIGSGDLGYLVDEPCPCGKTSPRIGRLVGRVGEGVKVRGMFIQAPEVEDVISRLSEISNYQLIISRTGVRDIITARLEFVNESMYTEELRQSLEEQFHNRCRLKLNVVEVVPQDTIPEDARKIVDERKEMVI